MKIFIRLLKYTVIVFFIFSCSEDQQNVQLKNDEKVSLSKKRIVYEIPEMHFIKKYENINFLSNDRVSLNADIYQPSSSSQNGSYPYIVLVNNYPDSVTNHYWGCDQKNLGLFESWAELIAASGIVAITYQTQKSHAETDSLISFLHKSHRKFKLDTSRIGLFGLSANALGVQSLMERQDLAIKCAIMNYGILSTPDKLLHHIIDSTANEFGYYWKGLRPATTFPSDIPMLITSAGRDKYDVVRKTTNHFVLQALKSNVPLTYIHYPQGQHDFDMLDDTPNTELIIKQMVDFMKSHMYE